MFQLVTETLVCLSFFILTVSSVILKMVAAIGLASLIYIWLISYAGGGSEDMGHFLGLLSLNYTSVLLTILPWAL